MMRWWWFGPAVTQDQLEREMRLMKEGGIGGFEIQPVYPLELDDPKAGFRNLGFLSEEFLQALRFTSAKARELGLRVDLTLGSGWPYGGPNIPISQAAGRLRCDRVPIPLGARELPVPAIGEGERLIAAFLVQGDPKGFSVETARELPVTAQGKVPLPADLAGGHTVLFVISSRTRQTVKRPSVGAEGFVLDHYDRAALDNHLKAIGEPLLGAFGAHPPYAIFCDSLEVFGSDWTGDLLDEFRRRRGYDLRPYLPALLAETSSAAGAVRHDWALTLTELAEERFLKPLAEWAHRHGVRLRVQAYGTPPVALASNALVDLPEGEQSHWRRFSASRWASSASHLLDRPVTSSETWTWLHSPAFRATPLDMKAEADRHFLQGINQLIGHGWPYSPSRAGEPGWRFYAAAVFNHQNPWWLVMPEITAYLQRVSFLLRQGRPANAVAIYLPTADARARFSLGRASIDRALEGLLGPHLIPQVLSAGYSFDFIDDGTIDRLPGRYAVVVLPGVERIPLATYQCLEAFVRNGGGLVAARRAPSLAPGLAEAEAQGREIREISRRLFEGPSAPAQLVADETVQLRAALSRFRAPDVRLTPTAEDIGFIRRSAEFAEIYFLANTGNQPRRVEASFRVASLRPECWNPFSGEVTPARVVAQDNATTTVALDLEPYGSRLLVFSKRPAPRPAQPDAAPPTLDPIALGGAWKVSFEQTGRSITMDRLRSWTDDPETRFYSGVAAYEKTVTVPAELLRRGDTLFLDFGEARPELGVPAEHRPGMRAWLEAPVREAAVVYVNGKRAGAVWKPPYEVNLTGLLRPGENQLRILVANTAINRLADGPLPDYTALERQYGSRFQPQDMENLQPVPSGLLGNIRLLSRPAREQLSQ